MKKTGLLHIYYGDGKGKTTAAFGLAFRCAARGGRVLIAQFLKDGGSGEMIQARITQNVQVLDGVRLEKFVFQMSDSEKATAARQYERLLDEIAREVFAVPYQLLVLDELLGAVETGLVGEGRVLRLLEQRPAGLEVVLTGRNPTAELLGLADYASEIIKRRHPYDQGTPARRGIEY